MKNRIDLTEKAYNTTWAKTGLKFYVGCVEGGHSPSNLNIRRTL